jgi:O-antigen biosynthesis protein
MAQTLLEIKQELGGRDAVNKEDVFIEEYDRVFTPLRDKPIRLLEIGLGYGRCLELWEKYFPNAEIVGIENEPTRLGHYSGDRLKVYLGDQTDTAFLDTLGDFDIIIDDGGHTMKQQQTSFWHLFPKMKDGGIYVIEDLHTSYWGTFIDYPITTIDFIKSLVDTINKPAITHSRSDFKKKVFPKFDIYSMYLTDSLCIIVKGKHKTKDY